MPNIRARACVNIKSMDTDVTRVVTVFHVWTQSSGYLEWPEDCCHCVDIRGHAPTIYNQEQQCWTEDRVYGIMQICKNTQCSWIGQWALLKKMHNNLRVNNEDGEREREDKNHVPCAKSCRDRCLHLKWFFKTLYERVCVSKYNPEHFNLYPNYNLFSHLLVNVKLYINVHFQDANYGFWEKENSLILKKNLLGSAI